MKNYKIAVLTSGGDAPGMNKAIATIVNYAKNFDIKSYVVINGFVGLCENDIRLANLKKINRSINQAGSLILCSRFKDFNRPENFQKAIDNLKSKSIDCLIILGGNGSYMGAKLLAKNGINVICLPCTIDNDINYTEYSIGFDSAINTISNNIDLLRTTAKSDRKIYLIELMGRKCSTLTTTTALANNIDYVITPQNKLNKNELVEIIKRKRKLDHQEILVLITENLYSYNELYEMTTFIETTTGINTKLHIMGFIQRGAPPTGIEKYNATRMGMFAIDCILNKNFNVAIGIDGKKMLATNLLTNEFSYYDNEQEIGKILSFINKH